MKQIHRQILLAVLATTCITLHARAQEASWQRVAGEGGTGNIAALAIDGSDRIIAQRGGTTLRSTDGGATWQTSTGVSGTPMILRVDGDENLYIGTRYGSGLFRSTDNGATWKKLGTVPETIWDVAVDSEGRIYLATEGARIRRSTNEGVTWTEQGDWPMSPFVWAIGVGDGDFMVAGSQGEGVFTSTDNGATWVQSPGLQQGVVNGLGVTPWGVILAGLDGGGLRRSTDNGVSWTEPTLPGSTGQFTVGRTIPFTSNGIVYVYTLAWVNGGMAYNVYRSSDEGESWTNITGELSGVDLNALALDSHGTLYAATNSGIYKLAGTSSAAEAPAPSTSRRMFVASTPNVVGDIGRIDLDLPAGHVRLTLVNSIGEEAMTLVDESVEAGRRSIEWNRSALPGGAYFYRLVVDGRSEVLPVVIR